MILIDGAVTTGRNPDEASERAARELAAELGVRCLARRGRAEAKLMEEEGAARLYVVERDGEKLTGPAGAVRFHQNTAAMRLKNGLGGDPLVRAAGLAPGDRVLDATLGLGCDALVAAAHLSGPTLTGIEVNPFLAALVRRGLGRYSFTVEPLRQAAKRIRVETADSSRFLEGCEEGAFDVVFFDPHFDRTVEASASMRSLRGVSDLRPLDRAALDRARRVARKCVVVKARTGEHGDLPFNRMTRCGRFYYGTLDSTA